MRDSIIIPLWKSWWRHTVFRHIFYWSIALLLYILFYLSINVQVSDAIQMATYYVVPSVIPVYLHFIVLVNFFQKKRYFIYFISVILIIFCYGAIYALLDKLINFSPIISHPSYYIFGALIAIVISTGYTYYAKGAKQQIQLHKVEYEQLQTELKLLKSQINPHFFFNTLNNLYSLSLDKSNKLPDYILKLSDLMRYALDSSKKQKVKFLDEINFIRNYIDLQSLRLSTKIDTKFKSDRSLNNLMIEPLLLVPFIENSYKHGLSNALTKGYLHIRLVNIPGGFLFSVENSMSEQSNNNQSETSISGLDNVKRRLELLYPNKHELKINDTENAYRIILKIQI